MLSVPQPTLHWMVIRKISHDYQDASGGASTCAFFRSLEPVDDDDSMKRCLGVSHEFSTCSTNPRASNLARPWISSAWSLNFHSNSLKIGKASTGHHRVLSGLDRKRYMYGLIPGGQNLSRRQSVFFLPVDPRDKNHRDPENIDYSVPRRARYVQNIWKRHQDTVFWFDIDLGIIKEGLKFYQTRSNAIILQDVLPPSCIVRAERLKGGEPLYKRQYLSPRPPPKRRRTIV